jgi:hypothetical protein
MSAAGQLYYLHNHPSDGDKSDIFRTAMIELIKVFMIIIHENQFLFFGYGRRMLLKKPPWCSKAPPLHHQSLTQNSILNLNNTVVTVATPPLPMQQQHHPHRNNTTVANATTPQQKVLKHRGHHCNSTAVTTATAPP